MTMLRRFFGVPALATALAMTISVAVGFAFWAAGGTGTGSASVGSLTAPGKASTSAVGGTVTVTWDESTVTGGGDITYVVERRSDPGSDFSTTCGPQSTSAGQVSCDDTVASGTYVYRVRAVYNSWTAQGAESDPITVSASTTAPTVTVDAVTTPTADATPSFSGTYGTEPGDDAAVDVTVYSGSDTSGAVVATPTATLDTTAHTWSTDSLSSALTPDATYTVAARQHNSSSDLTGEATSTFVVDTTGATASAPGLSAGTTFGSDPTFVNGEIVTFTDSPSDASGVQSVSYYVCPTSVTNCTSGNGTLIGSSSAAAGNYAVDSSNPLASPDGDYKVVAIATDAVGNVGDASSATRVSVDTTPPSVNRPTVNGYS
jgi:hypothetical protein